MFRKRLLSSLFLIVSLALLIVYSRSPLGWLIPCLLTFLALLAWLEFQLMISNPVDRLTAVIFLVCAGGTLTSVFACGRSESAFFPAGTIFFPALFLVFILTYPLTFFKGENDRDKVFAFILPALSGWFYILWPLSCLLALLIYPYGDGRVQVAYFLLVVKGVDIAAYLTGKQWGKHPMAPVLSPHKTMEGGAGALLFAVLAGTLLGPRVIPVQVMGGALFLTLLLAGLSMLGDLIESLLKRASGMKDSGALIPGMGGILDLMDSLFLTSPVWASLIYFLGHGG